MNDQIIVTEDRLKKEGVPVCLNCLAPADPLQYYCCNCGGNEAINPLTPYISFVNIRFNAGLFGKVWRRFQKRQSASIVKRTFDLFVAIKCFPFVVFALPSVVYSKWKKHKRRDALRIGVCILMLIILTMCFWAIIELSSISDSVIIIGEPLQ